MIVAAYYLEQAADKRVDELESIPIDEDVKQADEDRKGLIKCYQDATRWSTLRGLKNHAFDSHWLVS